MLSKNDTGPPTARCHWKKNDNFLMLYLVYCVEYLVANIINSNISSVEKLYCWGKFIVYMTRSEIII